MSDECWLEVRTLRYSLIVSIKIFEGTSWSNNSEVDDQIFNISIHIFLHSRRFGGNPTSKWWKLNRIRLMTTGNILFSELLLKLCTNYTCLYCHCHVFMIDVQNLVHTSHIQTDNHTFLFWIKHQCLCHIGTSSIRNYHNIMIICKLNNELNLWRRDWINDNISNSRELSIS